MVRYVIRQSLGYLKKCDWPADDLDQWLHVVSSRVASAESKAPDGLKMHIVDMFYDELTLVGADDVSSRC